MPIFYSDNQTDFELTEPQITRWRHRYRGHKESFKLNIEDQQMSYDTTYLYQFVADLKARMQAALEVAEFGGAVDALVVWNDATPSQEPVSVLGVEALAAEVDRMRSRIKTLED